VSERWRAIPGYEGSYEVSDHGRVRGLPRVCQYGRRRAGKILASHIAKSNHRYVRLCRDGKHQRFGIHVLVLTVFVGPRPAGLFACHWDDDPTNNRLSNLRWATRSENVLDSVRNGTHTMTRRTHCPYGHEYTPENTYQYPQGNRACNECRRAYRESHREERRAKGREYMRRRRAQARGIREVA